MPCRHFEQDEASFQLNTKIMRQKLDDATRAACEACKKLIELGCSPEEVSDFLKEWWPDHQIMDEQRKAYERSVEAA